MNGRAGHPLILPHERGALVFGMDWVPLIGPRARHGAYRLARRYRATHLSFSEGAGSAAVGLATIPSGSAPMREAPRAAARCLAHLFPSGAVALVLEVPGGQFWFAAIHDGVVVTGTDALYGDLVAARAAVESVGRAFPQLVLLGAPNAPPAPDLFVLGATAGEHLSLTRVPRIGAAVRMATFLALVVAVVAGPKWLWQHRGPPPIDSAKGMPPPPEADWARAEKAALEARVVHGIVGTRLVIDIFHDLPIAVAGWGLARAECVPEHLDWRCYADYRRGIAGGDNDTLLHRVPTGWHLAFPSLDRVTANWRVSGGGAALDSLIPDTARRNDQFLLSQFQALSSAFAQLDFGRSAALPVAPPRDGRAISRPARLPRRALRPVRIAGPLRSAGLLPSISSFMEWSRVRLTLDDGRRPSVASSRFMIFFEGVLHEYESLSEPAATVTGGFPPSAPGAGRIARVRTSSCGPGPCADAGNARPPGIVGSPEAVATLGRAGRRDGSRARAP